jgi:hypothetical protein
MAGTDNNPRLGRDIVKKFGDESFPAFALPNLQPKPPVKLDPLQRLLEEANQSSVMEAIHH